MGTKRNPEPLSYYLESGERLNAEHPETFQIPPAESRHKVKVGDLVYLVFLPTEGVGGERMWVTVTKAGPICEGQLANDPIFIEDLEWGDKVTFRPEHIIDIREKRQRSRNRA